MKRILNWIKSGSQQRYSMLLVGVVAGTAGVAFILASSADTTTAPLYRTYNAADKHHFYTSDLNELKYVTAAGSKLEGDEGYVHHSQVSGTVPLIRVHNLATKDWFMSTSNTEIYKLVADSHYQDAKTIGYIYSKPTLGAVTLYRLYNPTTKDHFYTTQDTHVSFALNTGYVSEGITGYVLSKSGNTITTTTGVQAKQADGFVETVGINVHPANWLDTVYGNKTAVRNKLVELGVRHMRINLGINNDYGSNLINNEIKEFAAIGIHSSILLGTPDGRYGSGTLAQQIYALKYYIGGAAEAVEGPNEWDCSGSTNWVSEIRNYQQRLYTAINSDPALAHLPVLGPSFCRDSSRDVVGSMATMVDYANAHPYPGGKPTEPNISNEISRAKLTFGTKPLIATETGYHNAVKTSSGHRPVSERAMAMYVPQLFMSHYRLGVHRSYEYEIVNTYPDDGLKTDPEKYFGLSRNDFSSKPAFNALRNTITIMKDPGSPFFPGKLPYTLSGDTTNIRTLLMQKRDGSFYLAAWSKDYAYNTDTETDLYPAARNFKINFTNQVKQISVFKPITSASAQTTTTNVSAFNASVTPDITIYKIVP